MKVQCETCGGPLKVVKSAILVELGADAGLAMAAYLGLLLGPVGLAGVAPALWIRKKFFKAAKKSVGGFFQCSRCGKEASNKYVLSKIFQ